MEIAILGFILSAVFGVFAWMSNRERKLHLELSFVHATIAEVIRKYPETEPDFTRLQQALEDEGLWP